MRSFLTILLPQNGFTYSSRMKDQENACSLRYSIELASVISNWIGAAEKHSNCTTAFTKFSGKTTQSCRGIRVKYYLKKQLIFAKHSEKI
jgi:hypothetical protein